MKRIGEEQPEILENITKDSSFIAEGEERQTEIVELERKLSKLYEELEPLLEGGKEREGGSLSRAEKKENTRKKNKINQRIKGIKDKLKKMKEEEIEVSGDVNNGDLGEEVIISDDESVEISEDKEVKDEIAERALEAENFEEFITILEESGRDDVDELIDNIKAWKLRAYLHVILKNEIIAKYHLEDKVKEWSERRLKERKNKPAEEPEEPEEQMLVASLFEKKGETGETESLDGLLEEFESVVAKLGKIKDKDINIDNNRKEMELMADDFWKRKEDLAKMGNSEDEKVRIVNKVNEGVDFYSEIRRKLREWNETGEAPEDIIESSIVSLAEELGLGDKLNENFKEGTLRLERIKNGDEEINAGNVEEVDIFLKKFFNKEIKNREQKDKEEERILEKTKDLYYGVMKSFVARRTELEKGETGEIKPKIGQETEESEILDETEIQETDLAKKERVIESEEDLLRTKEEIDKMEKHLESLEENEENQNEIMAIKKGLNKLRREFVKVMAERGIKEQELAENEDLEKEMNKLKELEEEVNRVIAPLKVFKDVEINEDNINEAEKILEINDDLLHMGNKSIRIEFERIESLREKIGEDDYDKLTEYYDEINKKFLFEGWDLYREIARKIGKFQNEPKETEPEPKVERKEVSESLRKSIEKVEKTTAVLSARFAEKSEELEAEGLSREQRAEITEEIKIILEHLALLGLGKETIRVSEAEINSSGPEEEGKKIDNIVKEHGIALKTYEKFVVASLNKTEKTFDRELGTKSPGIQEGVNKYAEASSGGKEGVIAGIKRIFSKKISEKEVKEISEATKEAESIEGLKEIAIELRKRARGGNRDFLKSFIEHSERFINEGEFEGLDAELEELDKKLEGRFEEGDIDKEALEVLQSFLVRFKDFHQEEIKTETDEWINKSELEEIKEIVEGIKDTESLGKAIGLVREKLMGKYEKMSKSTQSVFDDLRIGSDEKIDGLNWYKLALESKDKDREDKEGFEESLINNREIIESLGEQSAFRILMEKLFEKIEGLGEKEFGGEIGDEKDGGEDKDKANPKITEAEKKIVSIMNGINDDLNVDYKKAQLGAMLNGLRGIKINKDELFDNLIKKVTNPHIKNFFKEHDEKMTELKKMTVGEVFAGMERFMKGEGEKSKLTNAELEEIKEMISEERHDIDKVKSGEDLFKLLFSLQEYTGTVPRSAGFATIDSGIMSYSTSTKETEYPKLFLEMRNSAEAMESQELKEYYKRLIDKIEEIEKGKDEEKKEGGKSETYSTIVSGMHDLMANKGLEVEGGEIGEANKRKKEMIENLLGSMDKAAMKEILSIIDMKIGAGVEMLDLTLGEFEESYPQYTDYLKEKTEKLESVLNDDELKIFKEITLNDIIDVIEEK